MKEFHDFCFVDLQLSRRTVYDHLRYVKKFFEWLSKPISSLRADDVRSYLLKFRNGNPCTYANVLKALRRFFRDFLGMSELVKSFKFPNRSPKIKRVPSKDELKRFYEALDNIREKTIFLLMASSGLRRGEALNLKLSDVDFENRMLLPKHDSKTKRSYITFYNDEAEKILKDWLNARPKNSDRLFPMRTNEKHRIFLEARQKTGIHITPQILREWFACEMGRLGVPDRYVDAFCGRVPRSILARHYTDFGSERLKEIYDKTGLRVLS